MTKHCLVPLLRARPGTRLGQSSSRLFWPAPMLIDEVNLVLETLTSAVEQSVRRIGTRILAGKEPSKTRAMWIIEFEIHL